MREKMWAVIPRPISSVLIKVVGNLICSSILLIVVVHCEKGKTPVSNKETGLYRSLDGGQTWAFITPTTNTPIRIDAISPTTLYLEFSRSLDEGKTWKDLLNDPGVVSLTDSSHPEYVSPVQSLMLDPLTPTTLYSLVDVLINPSIFSERRLAVSTDRGDDWSTQALPFNPSSLECIHTATVTTMYISSFSCSTCGLFVTDSPFATVQLFQSRDNGASWSAKGLPFTGYGLSDVFRKILTLREDPSYLIAIIEKSPQNTIYGGIYTSTTGGESWSPTNLIYPECIDVTFSPSNSSVLYAGCYRDLWKSQDTGRTWFLKNGIINGDIPYPPYGTTCIQKIIVSHLDPQTLYIIICKILSDLSMPNLWKSEDGGNSWNRIESLNGWDVYDMAIHPINPMVMYIVASPE